MSDKEKKKPSLLKPSGYDVVIRNTLAMRRINRKLDKAEADDRDALLVEKDRLMEEMWRACPHESVVRCDDVRSTLFGPKPVPTCLCTSCGLYEQSASGRFPALKRKRGRTIVTLARSAFSARLGETLKRTGINAPSS
ncbi:MAG TPA: hypothetical protein VJ694_00250 [Patescibacteria group bacterium]|nr:hypothetical protein [Patescibacteria group bacterium]